MNSIKISKEYGSEDFAILKESDSQRSTKKKNDQKRKCHKHHHFCNVIACFMRYVFLSTGPLHLSFFHVFFLY
jgi:hypothetical protein